MITVYYEKDLRTASIQNSKMRYLNVSIKGLNGRPHPALDNVLSSNQVQKMRAHVKMLCMDLYTYETRASFQGGSPNCRLCESTSIESHCHIIASCSAYEDLRLRILLQMEIILRDSENKLDFKSIVSNKESLSQFILDCTSLNLPVRTSPSDEVCPRVFQLSRDLCYSIYKRRLTLLRSYSSE